jgi:hypothetical protein
MARQQNETSVLMMHAGTPEARAARTIPTPLMPMLAARAIERTRHQYPGVPLTWVHHDHLMRTHTTEEVPD